jgi:hypothetical protein
MLDDTQSFSSTYCSSVAFFVRKVQIPFLRSVLLPGPYDRARDQGKRYALMLLFN